MRLIDADALNIDEEVMQACELAGITELSGESGILAGWIIGAINLAKTIDAVPVVRCRDCKYYGEYRTNKNKQIMRYCMRMAKNDMEYHVKPDDFCSYGEYKKVEDKP